MRKKQIGFASALVMVLVTVAPAMAQSIKEPISGGNTHFYYDYSMSSFSGSAFPPTGTDIYNNTATAPIWALSSSDTIAANNLFGDWGLVTAPGRIHEDDFTVYNGAASASPITSLTMTINLYNDLNIGAPVGGPNCPLLGTFSLNLSWANGLNPGYYSIVTVTNLDSLGMNLTAAHVLETQQVSNQVGGSRGAGIVVMDPPTVGSSGASMYWKDAGSGRQAGFYAIDNPQTHANPGYRVNVAPEPTTAMLMGLVGCAALIRRRKA